MNSSQRIMAAIQGQPADRRAISLTLSLYGAGLINCPLEKYYRDPDAYAQGQIAVKKAVDPDVIFGPFALALFADAFGSKIRFMREQAPNLVRPVLEDANKEKHQH